MTLRDILTNILITADYPEVKREGFVKSFYEYLMVKLLDEIAKTDPASYQKLTSYFDNDSSSEREIQEGLREAYLNPELKAKLDKVVDEVLGGLADDVAKYGNNEQKQQILSSLSAA